MAQKTPSQPSGGFTTRVLAKKGYYVVLPDTSFIVLNDTVIVTNKKIRVRKNPYEVTESFYDSLDRRTSKRKITNEIHDLVIKSSNRKHVVDSVIVKSEDVFKPYDGLTIRSIKLLKVDLLEGSVIDTLRHAKTKFGKFVNAVHMDTRDVIIRNNLMFNVGDKVDPYQLSDNERILRQFKTIRDARIYVKPVEGVDGMVDIVVATQDVVSLGASGGYSSLKRYRIEVYDINIMGYAKELGISYFRNKDGSPQDGYEITLRQPNIGGSFIDGEITYTNNYLRHRTLIAAGREFITPSMRYAGGIELFRTQENYLLNENDTFKIPYTQKSYDVWAGRSFLLGERTNLIFSARNQAYKFADRPYISPDSNNFFFNRNLYLASITLIKRNFFKSSLINGFGRTEDVPVNSWLSTTGGFEKNTFSDRYYADIRTGVGKYLTHFGYFSVDFTFGGFYRIKSWEDGILNINGTYFSNLLKLRKVRLRQFVNFSYVHGYDRTIDPTVNILNGKWRSDDGLIPLGHERISMGTESVYFTPWYFYGFKFALYHGVNINFLKTSSGLLHRQNIFPSVKAGIRTLNDHLVFPTLSIDFSYYFKAAGYSSAYSLKISTTLPRLFQNIRTFRPELARFQ